MSPTPHKLSPHLHDVEKCARLVVDPILALWHRIPPNYEHVRHLSDAEFREQIRELRKETRRCLALLNVTPITPERSTPRPKDRVITMPDKPHRYYFMKPSIRRTIMMGREKTPPPNEPREGEESDFEFKELEILDPLLAQARRHLLKSKLMKKLSEKNPQEETSKTFRAHPVPLATALPRYDQIVAKKEARSRKIRERRQLQLLADEKPFSFWGKGQRTRDMCSYYGCQDDDEEDFSGEETKGLDRTRSRTSFRARPAPQHVLGARAKEKIKEEEIYRRLRRQLRADEMLRTASLPPSMAKREQSKSETASAATSPKPPPSPDGNVNRSRLNRPSPTNTIHDISSSLVTRPLTSERGRNVIKIPVRPPSLSPPASYRICGDTYYSPLPESKPRSRSAPPIPQKPFVIRPFSSATRVTQRSARSPSPKTYSPVHVFAPGPSWLNSERRRRREWARRLKGTRVDIEKTLAHLLRERRDDANIRSREWLLQREAMMDRVWVSPTLVQRQGQLARNRNAARRWKAALDLARGKEPAEDEDEEDVD